MTGGGHFDLQQLQQCHGVVVVKLPVVVSKVGLLTDVASAAGGEKKKCLELLSDNEVTSGRSSSSSSSSSKGLLVHHKSRVIVIAGPTAVGKSNVAIALAKQLDGEIISADSIQVVHCFQSFGRNLTTGFVYSFDLFVGALPEEFLFLATDSQE